MSKTKENMKINALLKFPCRVALAGLLAASGVHGAPSRLEKSFVTPPPAAKPHVYWYWMNGNISREGLTADLEAMKRAGIGGAGIFNIGGHGGRGPINVLSPEWRELMRHAIREAGRLGIEINLNNSMSGWSSSGGPWITPDLAMQKITWSETPVSGGIKFDAVLSQPPALQNYYRDVAVIVFPTPGAERAPDPIPTFTSSDPKFDPTPLKSGKSPVPVGGNWDGPSATPAQEVTLEPSAAGQDCFVQMEYAQPFAPNSMRLAFAGGGVKGTLQASEDGRQWKPVTTFVPRGNAPVDLALAAAPARYWRVVLVTTSTIRLTELQLSARYRIAEWTGKAMFDPYGLDKPSFTSPSTAIPEACVIHHDQIIDLTGKMDASGRLVWDVPPGQWTILRFGRALTGSQNAPSDEPGGLGLECDKLNAAALDVHFKNSLQPWFDDKELNPLIQYVHVDSYERGAANWTARMPEEFRLRRQYDLRFYLPVLTGRVVDGVGESERFLWDFRNVVTGLMHDNYFGRMQELCRKAGKQFTLEPYHQTQFDNVTAGGYADVPMCECWMGGAPAGPYWTKLGASPAHVYGKPIVGAEAFTAPGPYGGDWSTDFWSMKDFADAMFAGGVNRMMFHVYVHQPYSNIFPGWTLAIFGTHFERSNTWWEQMPEFTRYISRCQHLLQQGKFVGDVLYSCGENSPNESLDPSGPMAPPRGYDYDICDPKVIFERLSVKDGQLVLPDGVRYRLLVLPDDSAMTPAMAKRIGELVKAGATVIASKPTHSPSLSNQPNADQQVRELAETIWSDCDGKKATEHAYGRGRIYWGKPLTQVLAALNLPPDFDSPNGAPVRYIHRKTDAGDLYFVANGSTQSITGDAAFRSGDGAPQLWDPVTGKIRPLPRFHRQDERTIVPLRFEPKQSYFVLFSKSAPVPVAAAAGNFPEMHPVAELTGSWEVAFDPKWGGPQQIVFDKLEDWTQRPESGIKYYSGKATYRKSFDLPANTVGRPLYLDLGKIKNVAEVRLNGRPLGIVWCAPWQVEITPAVKPAGNRLEIDVVNLWPNRMIGDEQLPADCEWSTGAWVLLTRLPEWFVKQQPRTSGRFTFMTHKPYTKDSPLLESGLLGPVTIQAAEEKIK